MFSESVIGQHLLDNPVCFKNNCDKKFTILSFGRSSFYLSALEAMLHQIMQVKFMPPKRVCLQLETLALITCYDASLKHPIIFVQLLQNQLNFSFLHSDVCLQTSVGRKA